MTKQRTHTGLLTIVWDVKGWTKAKRGLSGHAVLFDGDNAPYVAYRVESDQWWVVTPRTQEDDPWDPLDPVRPVGPMPIDSLPYPWVILDSAVAKAALVLL